MNKLFLVTLFLVGCGQTNNPVPTERMGTIVVHTLPNNVRCYTMSQYTSTNQPISCIQVKE